MPQMIHRRKRNWCRTGLPAVAAIVVSVAAANAQEPPPAGATAGQLQANLPNTATPTQIHGQLLDTPTNTIVPGAAPGPAPITNPALSDPAAAERGQMAFAAFNCIGCHMGNGGGGMGPALSAGNFIYGSEPQNIYLTIVQGRPRGMPAWGTVIPNNIVWDLVAYIRNLSAGPKAEWGQTISPTSPSVEQVPAEFNQAPNPWQQTEPFKNGQKP
jgi:cytochrome c oxidase cbb3-type subunit 3